MRLRLSRAAPTRAPAWHPPPGLPGLDLEFSRIVDVPESGSGSIRRWHILDNAGALERRGVTPVGTILCVHGNPTWSYLWRKLVSAASATDGTAWRVIAVDQLEMGFSERTGTRRTLPRRVRDLGDLTAALGITGPVVSLGHDWGGVISLGWALDHPDLVSGIVLLNTAVHQPEGEAIPAALRLALQPSLLPLATMSTPAFLETTLALAHPPLSSAEKNGFRAPYRTAARRRGIGAFVEDIPVGREHPSRAELDRIAEGLRDTTVPALLLWGPRDPVFGDRYLADLIDRLPHADVHRFEGAGHLVAEDVDYASAVLAWAGDRVPGASPESPATAVPRAVVHDPQGAAGGESTTRPLWYYLDALRESDDVALVELAPPSGSTRTISWRLLSLRVRQIAAGLSAAGVKEGDRVSLLIPPGADLTAVLYACLRIGAIVVVADAGLGLPGLTRAVRGARPDHVVGALPGLLAARALGWPGRRIATRRLPPALARALDVSLDLPGLVRLGRTGRMPPPPKPADTAAVLFTSGSTGPAKGVVYTHAQLSAVRDTLAAQYGVVPGTGLVAGFAPFALLGPALGVRSVAPDMDVTAPSTLTAVSVSQATRAAAEGTSATVLFLSPAALANVVATADRLSAADRSVLNRVNTFLSAGAPVSAGLLAEASRLMPSASAHTPYGMTEGLLMTDGTLPGMRDSSETGSGEEGARADDVGPGGVCVGRPATRVRVAVSALGPDGRATGPVSSAPGVTGEIVVSAPHLKDGYDRLWLTDRAAERGIPAGERWHRTGDVGHLDSAGRLWVEGRLPHVIVTAEGVITPVGSEQRIERIPAAGRAAIVGIGPSGTQQVVAVLETSPSAHRAGLASPELASAVRASVDVAVAAVLVVPRLPTDIRHNSKIDRLRVGRWAAGVLAGERRSSL